MYPFTWRPPPPPVALSARSQLVHDQLSNAALVQSELSRDHNLACYNNTHSEGICTELHRWSTGGLAAASILLPCLRVGGWHGMSYHLGVFIRGTPQSDEVSLDTLCADYAVYSPNRLWLPSQVAPEAALIGGSTVTAPQ